LPELTEEDEAELHAAIHKLMKSIFFYQFDLSEGLSLNCPAYVHLIASSLTSLEPRRFMEAGSFSSLVGRYMYAARLAVIEETFIQDPAPSPASMSPEASRQDQYKQLEERLAFVDQRFNTPFMWLVKTSR
jgi:hypothetical protein